MHKQLILSITCLVSQTFCGRFDEAKNLYQKSQFSAAVEKFDEIFAQKNINPKDKTNDPEQLEAFTEYAESVLGTEDYEKGFELFDVRLDNGQLNRTPLQNPWDGNNPKNKTIVVVGEHGLGDTFMFSRYLKELKKHDAYIVFVPQRPLRELYKHNAYINEIRKTHEVKEDEQDVYLLSLPRYLSTKGLAPTSIDTIPAKTPYINSTPEHVDQWKKFLNTKEKLQIALCWRASQNAAGEYRFLKRDVPIDEIIKTLKKIGHDFELISLQGGGHKAITQEELEEIKEQNPETNLDHIDVTESTNKFIQFDDFDGSHGPFMDTAALTQAMGGEQVGEVISVDTSVAHIAAATGANVHVLIPKESDWRWGENPGETTPWYPKNVRVYQQEDKDNWSAPLKALKTYLRQKYSQ